MTNIESQFNAAFSHWGIALPQDAVAGRRRGKIVHAGWAIWYLFGVDDRGEYLDYYACHRMTGDSHVRIYADGHSEGLPSIREMRLCSSDPVEDARLDAEYYAENQKIAAMLQEKGFGIAGDEPGGVQINRHLHLEKFEEMSKETSESELEVEERNEANACPESDPEANILEADDLESVEEYSENYSDEASVTEAAESGKRRTPSLAVLVAHHILRRGTRLHLIRPPRPGLEMDDEDICGSTFLQGNKVLWDYDNQEYSLSSLCRKICLHCGGAVGAGAFAGPEYWALEDDDVSLAARAREIEHVAVITPGTGSAWEAPTSNKENTSEAPQDDDYGSFVLASGRIVYLARLMMRGTFDGLIIGTREWASQHRRLKVAEDVAEAMRPGTPLVVLDDGAEELPPHMWVAEFRCDTPVKEEDRFFRSSLFVCWFSDRISDTLKSDLQTVLNAADFEAHAEDYFSKF